MTDPQRLVRADILERAFAMLAIGNDAVRKAQARNRELGIPNYYSIGGRIVSDRPEAEAEWPPPPPQTP